MSNGQDERERALRTSGLNVAGVDGDRTVASSSTYDPKVALHSATS